MTTSQPDSKPSTTSSSPAPKKPILPWLIAGGLSVIAVVLLLLTIWQYQAAESLRASNAKAIEAYQSAPNNAGNSGTDVALSNVDFCWTNNACALLETVTGKLKPNSGNTITVDTPTSYHVALEHSQVRMNPIDFAGMLNDSIFNYPESALRNLKVNIVDGDKDKGRQLEVTGNIKVLLWIPFDMRVSLGLKKDTNELQITVNDLDVLGIIPATWAIKIDPLNLEELLPLPKNNHLRIVENSLFIKPFGLFPPPRITGTMDTVAIEPKTIYLEFNGEKRNTGLKNNGIKLNGGRMQFGQLTMAPVAISISDKNPENPFRFNVDTYDQRLGESAIAMQDNGSVAVTMPDLPKP